MGNDKYVIGIDFGTDSVRPVIVNALNGEEVSSYISYFKRWMEGKYCDAAKNQFRQHPKDHIESLEESIEEALKNKLTSSLTLDFRNNSRNQFCRKRKYK